MATWGDIQTLVQYNLGRQSDANIVTLLPIWADIFQKKVQRDRNWWFLKTVADRTIDQNSQAYPLPSNFKDDMIFYIRRLISAGASANEFIELDPISDLDVIRSYQPVDVAGANPANQKAQPEAYVIGDATVTFWPWPDKQYSIRCQFWKDITPPVASSPTSYTNSWITNYPDLYANALTAEGFKYLGETQDAVLWEARAKDSLKDIRAAHIARELPGKLVLVPMRDQFGTTRNSQNATWKVYN